MILIDSVEHEMAFSVEKTHKQKGKDGKAEPCLWKSKDSPCSVNTVVKNPESEVRQKPGFHVSCVPREKLDCVTVSQ